MRPHAARTFHLVTALLAASLTLTVGAGTSGASQVPRGTTVPLQLNVEGTGAILLGHSVTLWANATGGLPPYRFAWLLNGTNVTQNLTNTSTVGQRFTFLPLGDAIYTVTVSVHDAGTNASSQPVPIDVTGPGPVSVTLSATAQPGAAIRLIAHPVGGTPPYTYRWTGPGAPAGPGTSSELNLTSLPTGFSNFTVVARDAQGFEGSARVTVHDTVANGSAPVPAYLWFVVGLIISLGVVLAVTFLVYRRRARPPVGSPASPPPPPPKVS